MISRTAILIHVAVACLALNAFFPRASYAAGEAKGKSAKAAPAGDKEKKPDVGWEVRGWGRTQGEAERYALDKARALVEKHLREQDPPVAWSPTVEYVRKQLVRGDPRRREELDRNDVVIGDERVKALAWSLTVQVTPQDLEDMRVKEVEQRLRQAREEREGRAAERLLLAIKVFVGLVVALLAVTCYVRIDDWTRGFYSRWLAAGAVGLVVAAVAFACVVG
jgi:hypothetical protein